MELTEIADRSRKDFRRANGAPMYVDRNGKNQRVSRPSGWGKTLDDENALVLWKINRAMEGVAKSPVLQAQIAALKDDKEQRQEWSDAREKAINAGRGDEAADIGTALHAMSDRWEDPDDDFDPGDPFTAHLTAYSNELDRLGIVSELVEFQVVNEKRRAAGTADRLYRLTRPLVVPTGEILPEGTLVIGDLKTGKKLDFSMPGYAVQLAIYAEGERYNVETDEFMETPTINQDWGLLIHMPSDRVECQALWIDLEVGRWGAYLVEQVKLWRKNWRSGEFAGHEVIVPPLADEIAEALGGEVIPIEEADEEWVKMMTPWAQERLNDIGKHDQAVQYLRVRWPKGLPTPKRGIETPEQMKQVLDLLDKTEAEFQLPFPTGRPGTERGHKSTLNTTNNPKEKS